MTGTAVVSANTRGVQQQQDTGLVYPNGLPIIREVMTEKIAAATLTGVRQAIGMIVTPGLDPQGLASLMLEAIDGDPYSYMSLAEEIEEKELQYATVLGTRKRQVAQLDISIEAGSQQRADKQITAACQDEMIDSGLIESALFDMLDAVGKGYSLTEIVWDLQGSHWGIASLDYVDPRFIRFDRPTRRIPLLRADNDGGIGLPLPPYKFAWLRIQAKSGLPVRSGIVRPVAWAWMFKNFALKDWVQFCEVFGMPLRVGKFAPGASESDKDALLRAVSAISSDAACIIPSNMDIVFQETKSGGSGAGDVHGALTTYLDEQITKVVLGQTGTTQSTPGKLGGTGDHTQVREDIERADARALTVCINRDIIRPWVDLNWGPQQNYPYVQIGITEPRNAAIMVDTALKLVPFGLKVAQKDITAAVGFNTPEAGDELLVAPGAGAGAPPPSGNAIPTADLKVDLSTTRRAHLLAYELLASEAGDAIERVTQSQLADYKSIMGDAVKQILAAAQTANSFAEFEKRIQSLHAGIDMTPLAKRLLSLTFQAYAGGALGREIEDRPLKSLASAAAPYGDVEYADPGYQPDKKKRYPLDTEDRIRAAWTYIHQEKDRALYTAAQVHRIEGSIVAAWKAKIDKAGPPSAQPAK
ncbi:MAG: phage portal protein family protein [Rhizomicrobium sp.]